MAGDFTPGMGTFSGLVDSVVLFCRIKKSEGNMWKVVPETRGSGGRKPGVRLAGQDTCICMYSSFSEIADHQEFLSASVVEDARSRHVLANSLISNL